MVPHAFESPHTPAPQSSGAPGGRATGDPHTLRQARPGRKRWQGTPPTRSGLRHGSPHTPCKHHQSTLWDTSTRGVCQPLATTAGGHPRQARAGAPHVGHPDATDQASRDDFEKGATASFRAPGHTLQQTRAKQHGSPSNTGALLGGRTGPPDEDEFEKIHPTQSPVHRGRRYHKHPKEHGAKHARHEKHTHPLVRCTDSADAA